MDVWTWSPYKAICLSSYKHGKWSQMYKFNVRFPFDAPIFLKENRFVKVVQHSPVCPSVTSSFVDEDE